MRHDETTHEIEGIIHYTSAKARLVEDVTTGDKYWIPKSQTYDMNLSHLENKYYLLVVSDWWYKKRNDFLVED